jgi:hypothetical protein
VTVDLYTVDGQLVVRVRSLFMAEFTRPHLGPSVYNHPPSSSAGSHVLILRNLSVLSSTMIV